MYTRLPLWIMLCIVILTGLASCETESKIDTQGLIGRWELVKGLRNQKETETLVGTYFLFKANGEMMTNLPVGPEELVKYELTQTTIKQKVSPPVEYLVQQLTDTSLVLGLELRGMQFVMHFRRGTDAPPNNNSTPLETPGASQPKDSVSQEM